MESVLETVLGVPLHRYEPGDQRQKSAPAAIGIEHLDDLPVARVLAAAGSDSARVGSDG